MQILADVTRRRVEAVTDPQEAGAVGCALAVAVALKEYQDYRELKKVVKVRKSFEPRPECCGVYEEMYKAFRAVYGGLSGICRSLNVEGGACAEKS
jgi:xylulokinase